MKKMHQQYKLGIKTSEGQTTTVCWLETGLKVGNVITLKDDPKKEEWTVLEKYGLTREIEDIHKKWEVGGL